jgi:transaldolase
VDRLPPEDVVSEIRSKVNLEHLEDTLMAEGIKKFADPMKVLLALIAETREHLVPAQATL